MLWKVNSFRDFERGDHAGIGVGRLVLAGLCIGSHGHGAVEHRRAWPSISTRGSSPISSRNPAIAWISKPR
jgi:hypothetical protein